LFDRFQHLLVAHSIQVFDSVQEKNADLLKFLGQLNMGEYYEAAVKDLIDHYPMEVYFAGGEDSPQEHKDREERKGRYLCNLHNDSVKVEKLCIELLKYQNWPVDREH
jgi:hypothetical protein